MIYYNIIDNKKVFFESDIFNAFYEQTPTLVVKIQNAISSTKVFMARIVSQTPSIRTDKDAWIRGLTLNVFATPQ